MERATRLDAPSRPFMSALAPAGQVISITFSLQHDFSGTSNTRANSLPMYSYLAGLPFTVTDCGACDESTFTLNLLLPGMPAYEPLRAPIVILSFEESRTQVSCVRAYSVAYFLSSPLSS